MRQLPRLAVEPAREQRDQGLAEGQLTWLISKKKTKQSVGSVVPAGSEQSGSRQDMPTWDERADERANGKQTSAYPKTGHRTRELSLSAARLAVCVAAGFADWPRGRQLGAAAVEQVQREERTSAKGMSVRLDNLLISLSPRVCVSMSACVLWDLTQLISCMNTCYN